jgi:hypothetical protein
VITGLPSSAASLNRIEHQPSKLAVAGSSPAAVTNLQNDKAPPGHPGPGRGCLHRGQIGVSLAVRETSSNCLKRVKDAFTGHAPRKGKSPRSPHATWNRPVR